MNIQRFAAAVLLLGFSGCSVVVMDEPVGEQLTAEQKEEFAGIWVNLKGDPETVEFRVAEDGRLIAGNLKWDEEGQAFKVESHVFEPRRLGKQTILYFQPGEKAEEYFFGQMVLEAEGKLEIYMPEPGSFRTAVDSGMLPGRVEVADEQKQHFTVHLQSGNEATRRFLASPEWRKHYRKEPLVLQKLNTIVKSTDQAEESSSPAPASADPSAP